MRSDGTAFRFSTKKEYEDKMKSMLEEMKCEKPTSGSISDSPSFELYDELVEEYLEFCSR